MKQWEEKGISSEMQSRPKIKVSHLLSSNCFLSDALGMGTHGCFLSSLQEKLLVPLPPWLGGRSCNSLLQRQKNGGKISTECT